MDQATLRLFWKECREQRASVLMGCLMAGAFMTVTLRTRLIPDAEAILFCCLVCCTMLPILVVMGLLAPERRERTLASLLTLPTHAARVLTVKTAVGLLASLLPVAVTAAVAAAMAWNREIPPFIMVYIFTIAAVATAGFFIFYFGLSHSQSSEATAGLASLAGLLLLIGWWMLVRILSDANARFGNDFDDLLRPWVFLLVCAPLVAGPALWCLAVRRLPRLGWRNR